MNLLWRTISQQSAVCPSVQNAALSCFVVPFPGAASKKGQLF